MVVRKRSSMLGLTHEATIGVLGRIAGIALHAGSELAGFELTALANFLTARGLGAAVIRFRAGEPGQPAQG